MTNITNFIKELTEKQNLTFEESGQLFTMLLEGAATPAQISAVLIALKMKGETIDEIAGAAKILHSKSTKIIAPENALDTCGTGGDNSGSYNISTAVAFVVAGSGVPVAKHGNRSISSRSGSADILRELGVNIDASHQTMEKSLQDANICFMMAPKYHSSMRYVGEVRQELGVRTIFNILGPLANPAGTKYQLLGVYSKDLVEKLAKVLSMLGSKKAWVVHGSNGMDEITTTGISYVAQVVGSEVTNFTINPEDYGIKLAHIDDFKGGDAAYNANELKELLHGRGKKAYRDIVLLNSAAALVIAGKADNLHIGLELARDSIDSLKAKAALEKLVAFTR